METRLVADSRTIQHYLILPGDANAQGNLFGGRLLSWIDMLAGIVALRHTNSQVFTVAIDNITFQKSAVVSDVVTLDGYVTRTGRTSLEVRIDTYRENKGVPKELINTAYVVMVAVEDGTHTPKPVPQLIPETDAERMEWEKAEKRDALRKMRRAESY